MLDLVDDIYNVQATDTCGKRIDGACPLFCFHDLILAKDTRVSIKYASLMARRVLYRIPILRGHGKAKGREKRRVLEFLSADHTTAVADSQF